MSPLGRVNILGGGPAGLYLATLIRRQSPSTKVILHEQNAADATFGFGVVFSDQALDFLKADDPETHDLITPHMERWRNMTLAHKGERVTLDGIGFAAIGRLHLLRILQRRASDVGVEMRFEDPIRDIDGLDGDLIVGADGVNSLLRSSDEQGFASSLDHFDNRFAWFGADTSFETLTQTFVRTERGHLNAHHYRFEPSRSTFIVECDAATFDAYGFAGMDEDASAALCSEIFAETLNGRPLVTNKSTWRRFPKLWCDRWVAGNRVLLGDAAHTAHFSIGSGTRLAMEDAIALARSLRNHDDLAAALASFEQDRIPVARKMVDAANTSARWYDRFAEKMQLEPLDFAFDYLTRSGRVDMERLRSLAPEFVAAYERNRMRSAS
jgi:2-polyprenyl-6-methoxyphenol hydroxylase-like FAD-dependent oxidoreductase